MSQKADFSFPIRILFYKQRQLAIIFDKELNRPEIISLLAKSLEREFKYIKTCDKNIHKKSIFWSYYKFMEATLFKKCSEVSKEISELITLSSWDIL